MAQTPHQRRPPRTASTTAVPVRPERSHRGLVATMLKPDRPAPRPFDPPMLPFALGGMLLWAVIGLGLLPFRGWLAETGNTGWLWTCVAGFLLGFPGVATMVRHDANRRRRREAEAQLTAATTAQDVPPRPDHGSHRTND